MLRYIDLPPLRGGPPTLRRGLQRHRPFPLVAAAVLVATAAVLSACTDPEAAAATRTTEVAGDSILPMDTMIARFQAEHPPVAMISDDAPRSLDALIERFVAAVEAGSGDALNALTMDAAEFAYLYFPTSMYARPPYAQPPAVSWLLHEQNSLKGRSRLLREYGGKPVRAEGYACEQDPLVEGRNTIHERCMLRLESDDGGVHEVRLFASILERDGRYRIMSLANRL